MLIKIRMNLPPCKICTNWSRDRVENADVHPKIGLEIMYYFKSILIILNKVLIFHQNWLKSNVIFLKILFISTKNAAVLSNIGLKIMMS